MATRRREPPKVARQEVLWVPETRLVVLTSNERPYRVWTLYGEGRDDPKRPPKLPITPVHNHGAFLEDYVHDWNIQQGNVLRYYSRAVEHSVWILVEYAAPV